jgi:hypothetical protein
MADLLNGRGKHHVLRVHTGITGAQDVPGQPESLRDMFAVSHRF